LGALLPPIACLLSDDKPHDVHAAVVSQLLSFATAAPGSFKEAVGLMHQEQKDRIEVSVRQAVADRYKVSAQDAAVKPQITLRSF
jgi:hypothetical protein